VAETSFASLSPSLLARKGGAKPAMRPQHAALASMPANGPSNGPSAAPEDDEHLEDLGWNDMGDGETPTAEVVKLTPVARTPQAEAEAGPFRPAVMHQRDELANRIASPPAPMRAKSPARAAFTLRLDAQRHLKLRLATTIRGVSAQALVTEALDVLLGDMPELDTLAAQVKRR
jgi:hypothetical protein